jgi:POT family proton-dependent oligopeptide transporter
MGNADSVVRVSMFWLIAAYLFHTLGELCISPVGLSYVSKLVPAAWIGICLGCIYSSEWGINWRVWAE